MITLTSGDSDQRPDERPHHRVAERIGAYRALDDTGHGTGWYAPTSQLEESPDRARPSRRRQKAPKSSDRSGSRLPRSAEQDRLRGAPGRSDSGTAGPAARLHHSVGRHSAARSPRTGRRIRVELLISGAPHNRRRALVEPSRQRTSAVGDHRSDLDQGGRLGLGHARRRRSDRRRPVGPARPVAELA